jgi:hypothetical protein
MPAASRFQHSLQAQPGQRPVGENAEVSLQGSVLVRNLQYSRHYDF